jgi:hypothetical protein
MEYGDCPGARHALDGLEGSMPGASGSEIARVSDFESQVLRTITASCGSYTLTP